VQLFPDKLCCIPLTATSFSLSAATIGTSQYYIVVTIEGRALSLSTPVSAHVSDQTISSDFDVVTIPFNATFVIGIPQLRSQVTLTLIEAQTKRRVGSASFSALFVDQRMSDSLINSTVHPPLTRLSWALSRYYQNLCDKEDEKLRLRRKSIAQSDDDGSGTSNETRSNNNNNNNSHDLLSFETGLDSTHGIVESIDSRSIDNESTPCLFLSIHFEENRQDYFYSSKPLSLSVVDESLSVERLGIHIARFTHIISMIQNIYVEYCFMMSWEDPLYTMSLFIYFLFCTLRVDPAYALSVIVSIPVLLMTHSFWKRYTGRFVQTYIRDSNQTKSQELLEYRPVTTLRITVVAMRRKVLHHEQQSAHRFEIGHGHGHSDNNYQNEYGSLHPTIRVTWLCREKGNGKLSNPMESTSSLTGDASEAFQQPDNPPNVFQPATHELLIGTLSNQISLTTYSEMWKRSKDSQRDALLHDVLDPWPLDRSAASTPSWLSSSLNTENGVILSRCKDIALVYPLLQQRRTQAQIVAERERERSLRKQQQRMQRNRDENELETDRRSRAGSELSYPLDTFEREEFFVPWSQSDSSIRLALLEQDGEREEGEVVIPIKDILQSGTLNIQPGSKFVELFQWYKIEPLKHIQDQVGFEIFNFFISTYRKLILFCLFLFCWTACSQ
jgi:hypothetical protein